LLREKFIAKVHAESHSQGRDEKRLNFKIEKII
jgi:hypothetical protein